MLPLLPSAPNWRTTAPAELSTHPRPDLPGLDVHLARCRGPGGRLFAMRCIAESTHGLVAPRFVSTVLAIAAMILAASLVA